MFFQYLKWAYKKDGDRLYSRACCNRKRCNGFKLKEGGFRLDIRKNLFTTRVVKRWNRLPREVADAPIPGNIQSQVGWGFEQPGLVQGIPPHGRGV